MAISERAAGVIHGPRNGSGWTSSFDSEFVFGAYPANASQAVAVNTTSEQVLYVQPQVSVFTPFGRQQDALAADNIIANLNTIYLSAQGAAAAASLAGTTIAFFLRRAGAVVGGGAFAGWASASNPIFAAYTPVVVPWLPANTALQAPPGSTVTATSALLPLQPLDVITFSVVSGGATIPFFYCSLDIS